MQSSLKPERVRQKENGDELKKPGDFYIRQLPIYNSDKVIHAIIMKCPYCGMEMASTDIHRITFSKLAKILSYFKIPTGPTVKPKLVCPYGSQHIFSITNGRITATK